jgi:ATP-binding cassette subfamily F protein 3
MLLDEPTNHLDMDAREALTQALNNYTGAVILVSHDPHLVETVADRLWLVADGTCVPYEDDLEAYRNLVVQQRRRERDTNRTEARSKKADKKKAPLMNKAEKEAARLEALIADLIARRNEMENALATCSAEGDPHQLKVLHQAYVAL